MDYTSLTDSMQLSHNQRNFSIINNQSVVNFQ